MWESIKIWLVDNSALIGAVAAIIGTAIAVWLLFLGGLKTIWRWVRPKTDPAVESILDRLQAETKGKLEAEQERDELRKAVRALQQHQAGPQRDEALQALAEGKTEKAEALFLSIAEEREKIGSKANREAAEAWRHVGALAFLHDTQKALLAYVKATERDPDDPDGWNQLAVLQLRVGNLEAAEKSFNKVLSLGNRTADKAVIAAAIGNLGLIHKTRGDMDKAEEMFLKSLTLNQDLGRKEGMASCYGNLGVIRKRRGDLDKAEEMQLKALALDQELGRKEDIAGDYGNLGLIHQARGNLDKAEEMFLKSLALEEELGRKEGMASDSANLGVIHKMRGDLASACSHWRRSRDLYAEIGIPHMVEQVEGWMREAACPKD